MTSDVPSGGRSDGPVADFDVPGLVMRVRRMRDLSQRELAALLGLDQSQVARIESSRRRVDLPLLAEILALAELRIVVLDPQNAEVVPVPHDVLRDNGGRRMPAHLDVRDLSDPPMSTLVKPHTGRAGPRGWYHHRAMRDRRRAMGEAHAALDHPTLSGRAERGADLRVARLRRARRLAPTLLEHDCTCSVACGPGARCSDDCRCRCDR